MNSIATIGYTSNLYARYQKTINYFEFQAMLVDQVSDRLHWYATIHPRDEEDAYIDASERLGLCVQSRLNNQSKVLIIGGDLSGLSHVQSWVSTNNRIGVEGMSVADLNTFISETKFASICEKLVWTQGFAKSSVGIWWPKHDLLTKPSPLSKDMQVLYVPELMSREQMSILIDLLGD